MLEGSSMRGVCTARQLALWNNTHPGMGFMKKELEDVVGKTAVIVGYVFTVMSKSTFLVSS